LQALPDFLAETKFQDIVDGSHTVFQKAFNTDLSCFTWLPTQPKRFLYIQRQMAVQRDKDWLDVFPVEKEVDSWSAEPDKALFVDIGGGMGGQCRGFRAKYPKVPGRIILQELPQLVERLPPMEGIEKMAQNFFEQQTIEGASMPIKISISMLPSTLFVCLSLSSFSCANHNPRSRCKILLPASNPARLL
jgi:demethylsterigmatocystin 6-O-methyltransferase